MQRVFIALGANVSAPIQTLPLAWRAVVAALRLSDARLSPMVTSAPAEEASGADFANAVGLGYTPMTPRGVLQTLHRVERAFGRDRPREGHHGARPLDLDLLEYGSMISTDPTLTLPHPRIAQRWFVIEPLLALEPDWCHPLTGEAGMALLRGLQPSTVEVDGE